MSTLIRAIAAVALSATVAAVSATSRAAPAPLAAPVPVAEAGDVQIEVLAEVGYEDEAGRYVIDLLEQDYAYLAVRLTTSDGRPVQGALPRFSMEGSSQLLRPEEIATEPASDESGVVEFAVVGGQMGLDRVTVLHGEASAEIRVNVISLQAAGFPALPEIEGGIPWQDLMQARLSYQETGLSAEFPPSVEARAGETVKLSGFLIPLEPDMRPRHFLLTSNPPSCFFHIPGGPAGAVEVLTTEGIELSWGPVVLEGRFEPQKTSEVGVVYRLLDAALVKP